jgi:HPt (histidine-containing phosphotransfer) domain-containing protein
VLADLERDGEREFVRDVIDTFLQDTATLLESMRRAAACADLGALAAYGHRLKGSALLMNADRIAELSRDIEQHASLWIKRDRLAMIDQLDLAFQEVRGAMTACEAEREGGEAGHVREA